MYVGEGKFLITSKTIYSELIDVLIKWCNKNRDLTEPAYREFVETRLSKISEMEEKVSGYDCDINSIYSIDKDVFDNESQISEIDFFQTDPAWDSPRMKKKPTEDWVKCFDKISNQQKCRNLFIADSKGGLKQFSIEKGKVIKDFGDVHTKGIYSMVTTYDGEF